MRGCMLCYLLNRRQSNVSQLVCSLDAMSQFLQCGLLMLADCAQLSYTLHEHVVLLIQLLAFRCQLMILV